MISALLSVAIDIVEEMPALALVSQQLELISRIIPPGKTK
jgi:hypothetical protein